MIANRINAAGVMALDMPEPKKQRIVKSSLKLFEVTEGDKRIALGYVQGRIPLGSIAKVEFSENVFDSQKCEAISLIFEQAIKRFGIVVYVTKESLILDDRIKLKVGKDELEEPLNIYYWV